MAKTLIIIPAYNEQDTILSTVRRLKDMPYDYIVVNDGSTDATYSLCKLHSIPVLNLISNLGIGGAVQTGYLYARQLGYDIAIQFDADGQHEAASIPRLVEAIESGVDLVIGSRFVDDAEDNFKSTGLRRLGIKWLSAIIKFMTGKRIYDVTSGFRAVSRKGIDAFCKNYPQDYPEPESIVIAVRKRLKVKEIPVQMHERQGGTSSISAVSSVYYMIKVTLAIVIQGMNRHGRIGKQ